MWEEPYRSNPIYRRLNLPCKSSDTIVNRTYFPFSPGPQKDVQYILKIVYIFALSLYSALRSHSGELDINILNTNIAKFVPFLQKTTCQKLTPPFIVCKASKQTNRCFASALKYSRHEPSRSGPHWCVLVKIF